MWQARGKPENSAGNTAMLKFLSFMQTVVCRWHFLLNRQFYVHFCVNKISCATLRSSASAHHNLDLKILPKLELYFLLSSP